MAFKKPITTTNRDLLRLKGTLDIYGGIRDGRLAFALARNRLSIKSYMETLDEIRKPAPDDPKLLDKYQAYEAKRLELNREYSRKDAAGEPIQAKGGFVIEDQVAFQAAYKVLSNKHKDAVAERDRIGQAFEDALDMEVEFQVYAIPYRKVPEDAIAAQDLAVFLEFGIITGEPDWGDDDEGDDEDIPAPTPIKKHRATPKKKKKKK